MRAPVKGGACASRVIVLFITDWIRHKERGGNFGIFAPKSRSEPTDDGSVLVRKGGRYCLMSSFRSNFRAKWYRKILQRVRQQTRHQKLLTSRFFRTFLLLYSHFWQKTVKKNQFKWGAAIFFLLLLACVRHVREKKNHDFSTFTPCVECVCVRLLRDSWTEYRTDTFNYPAAGVAEETESGLEHLNCNWRPIKRGGGIAINHLITFRKNKGQQI